MKHLLLIFILLLCGGVYAQQTCGVPNRKPEPVSAGVIEKLVQMTPDGILCSKVFVQVDHDIIVQKGPLEARAWAEALMAEVAVPFADFDVELSYIFDYLDTPTYTDGNSYEMLRQFRDRADQHDGDIAIMLSLKSSGGIAWVDQSCKTTSGYRYAFANVQPDFIPYRDGYSWNVMVAAHELGHSYGCHHTQDPLYTIDGVPNQPIDGCYPVPGAPVGPIPTDGGTIMSYCHLNAVGISFLKGFHAIHRAIIRANVYARCLTCDNPGGDDGDDPPVVQCTENEIYINLILDAYPGETSYILRDANDSIIHQRGPFPRYASNGARNTGSLVADTLCLPNGCYSFEMLDVNGLIAEGCGEGLYAMYDGFGELASGQSFTNSETTRFCLNVDPPDPTCYDVVIDTLVSYSIQNRRGHYIFGGGELELTGNNWLAQSIDYTLTPETVLTGYFKRGDIGEIHGIGLVDQIDALNPGNVVRFGGTQRWGLQMDYIPANEWVYLEIPVGRWLPNITYTYAVFVNDFDRPAEDGDAVTSFRNLELCESGSAIVTKGAVPKAQGKVEDEDYRNPEADMQRWIKDRIERDYRKPYPNPVTDTLNLHKATLWHLMQSDGKVIATGFGKSVSMTLLPPGVYLLHDGTTAHKIVKK